MKTFSERGDTIIEVMIVLAVLSFAIIIGYSSANRSLADARQSEQNSYAAELAQSQIEQIRNTVINSVATTSGNVSNLNVQEMSGSQFCMSNGSAVLTSVAAFMTPDPCTPTNGITYSLLDTLIQPVPSLPNIDNFKVEVTWPDTLGEGQDTVTLFYQVSPPSP